MVDSQQNPLLGKIAAYTEILSSDPRSTIFVSLSESYRKMGMLDEALSVAVKGLDQLPDYAPGHVVLARIKCQQGDLLASEVSFKKALELDPDSLAALVGFSRLCLLQGNKLTARNLLLTARELSPADSVINKLLLSLPEPAVEPEEVEADVPPRAPEKPSPVEPLESATLADLYFKQGMVERALHIYQNLLTRDPDNLEFRRRIRDIELSSSRTTEIPAETVSLADHEVTLEPGVGNALVDSPVTNTDEYISPDKSQINEMSVLDQLNGLLNSIKKRRGDV